MQTPENNSLRQRAERAIGDIVLAELFVVQATIESAGMLGEKLTGLRNHLSGDETEEDFRTFLEHTREQLTEPYTTRFRYLREGNRERDNNA